MNILIVEDETALAEAVAHILRKAGHSADRVADGQSALDYIRVGAYDLVLLDIMLPKLDGLSVLRQMRSEGVQTPVLMLTARTTVPDKVAGLNAGADDYLTKPFDPEELLARVGAMTRRKGAMVLNEMEMSRNVQSENTQNLKSMVIQRSFPKRSVAERRKTVAASDQAAVCACAHSRYFTGGSPSGLRV